MVVEVIHNRTNWLSAHGGTSTLITEAKGEGRERIGWPPQAAREGEGPDMAFTFTLPFCSHWATGTLAGYYLSGPKWRQWSIRVLLSYLPFGCD